MADSVAGPGAAGTLPDAAKQVAAHGLPRAPDDADRQGSLATRSEELFQGQPCHRLTLTNGDNVLVAQHGAHVCVASRKQENVDAAVKKLSAHGGKVAGFIAHTGGKLVLHAMSSAYRGKGLAKFFWSKVCQHLFEQGHTEIESSISFVNIAVINLYATLVFRFRRPVDVYHRMVP